MMNAQYTRWLRNNNQILYICWICVCFGNHDSRVHGAHLGPTGPHVDPMNLAIWVDIVLRTQANQRRKGSMRIQHSIDNLHISCQVAFDMWKKNTANGLVTAKKWTDTIGYVNLGLCSLRRRRLISIGIPIINPRRSSDSLRFIMGIPIPIRRRLLSE